MVPLRLAHNPLWIKALFMEFAPCVTVDSHLDPAIFVFAFIYYKISFFFITVLRKELVLRSEIYIILIIFSSYAQLFYLSIALKTVFLLSVTVNSYHVHSYIFVYLLYLINGLVFVCIFVYTLILVACTCVLRAAFIREFLNCKMNKSSILNVFSVLYISYIWVFPLVFKVAFLCKSSLFYSEQECFVSLVSL